MPSNPSPTRRKVAAIPARRLPPTTARRQPFGMVGSALFHGLIFAAALFTLHRNFDTPQDSHVVPVDLVTVADQTNVAAQAPPTPPEPEKMDEIRRVAKTVPGALEIEKCFARRTGLRYHVDLHLEVDPEMTVRESHDIATQVRIRVKETLPWVADVLVHVEPLPDSSSHIEMARSAQATDRK